MYNISKYKVDKSIIISIFLFFIISLTTIYGAQISLNIESNLFIKQILWFGLGFVIAYMIMMIGNKYIIKHVWFLYGIGIISLILLLIFGDPINNAKCWFVIPGIGTFQPSEFMKIILIITLASMIENYNEDDDEKSTQEEFGFILKVGLTVLIPSILTFLQPDTGVVFIYLIITGVMLFIGGIRLRWFAIAGGIIALFIAFVVILFFTNKELFINILGTDFFLRIDRLLDWSNQAGFQLENGLVSIGSGGLNGLGLGKTPLYFPEGQTDFIFAVFASNFGFIGVSLLISLLAFFNIKLIRISIASKRNINKYLIAGIVGMLFYQQVQNIGMTFGLLPITGITLPFISYGGSSLLSYMIMLGIIFNISNEAIRYTN